MINGWFLGDREKISVDFGTWSFFVIFVKFLKLYFKASVPVLKIVCQWIKLKCFIDFEILVLFVWKKSNLVLDLFL